MKTNSNNINNSKSNKTKSVIALTSLIIVLSIVNITLLTGTIFGININTTTNANALSYSTSEDISFTFAPTLSIGLSANSLTIDNLVPGTTSDSNTVTVTVSSNTPYGYVLSAGVGSTESSDPYYNTSDLVHDNSTTQVPTTNKFSSIATSASLQTLDTDNTWGYSTSTDGGTNWSTYSGLSHAETKPLLDISDPAQPSTIDFKIAARSSSTQASGTYNNVITFYAVGKPKPPQYLYDEVAKMSKGTQTLAQLQESITAPTATDYTADTSNSGVYEYNSSVFGEASDASNANKIYYYRGILEPTADNGSYGSDGKATTYPNYVRLSNDTCWRIVRTTGSGGVKMIYNGLYDTTANSCANAVANANAVSSVYFNRGTTSSTNNYGTKGRVAYVGYNYNSYYGYGGGGAIKSGSIANSTLFSNGVASNARGKLESWYSSNMTAYTRVLETSAGYCNDRTTYTDTATNTLSTFTVPYKTSSATVNFGAYIRNMTTNDHPTLGCPNTTGQDLLTTSNGLDVPAALLTADEASFAGSGNSASYGSPYHANSFLRSGNSFWLLSPSNRSSGGFARGFYLASNLDYGLVNNTSGVRPAISLKPGTTAASGTGIATDPWVVTAP